MIDGLGPPNSTEQLSRAIGIYTESDGGQDLTTDTLSAQDIIDITYRLLELTRQLRLAAGAEKSMINAEIVIIREFKEGQRVQIAPPASPELTFPYDLAA